MSAFDVISLSLSAIALITALRLKRPIIPHIHFGKAKARRHSLEDAIEYVKKRDSRRLKGRDNFGRFTRKSF